MAGWVVQPLLQDNPFSPLPPSQLISPVTEGEAQLDYLHCCQFHQTAHEPPATQSVKFTDLKIFSLAVNYWPMLNWSSLHCVKLCSQLECCDNGKHKSFLEIFCSAGGIIFNFQFNKANLDLNWKTVGPAAFRVCDSVLMEKHSPTREDKQSKPQRRSVRL